ncbi:hypothetical protein SLEP1_g30729 [Rubroshorea leprosula]|uniref:Uncharacterized protein n=1 Tax=Rubroshorea leprosula TaxID=152421 RepID=A0AAV5K6J6_9ROSI|nr:hypothetical protein SLEP1_g30729 [Rubroshorea leprosula]
MAGKKKRGKSAPQLQKPDPAPPCFCSPFACYEVARLHSYAPSAHLLHRAYSRLRPLLPTPLLLLPSLQPPISPCLLPLRLLLLLLHLSLQPPAPPAAYTPATAPELITT